MRSSTSELHVGAPAPSSVILAAGWTCYRVVERDDFRSKVPPACTALVGPSFAAKEPPGHGDFRLSAEGVAGTRDDQERALELCTLT